MGKKTLLDKKNAIARKMTRIGSKCARMFFFKANRSEFNSLHIGCIGLCLQANVNPGMSETCVAAISFKAAARWR